MTPDHSPTQDRREPIGMTGDPTPTGHRPVGRLINCNQHRTTRRRFLVSGARLAQSVLLLSAHCQGQLTTLTTRRIDRSDLFSSELRETAASGSSQKLWRDAASSRCRAGRVPHGPPSHLDPGSDPPRRLKVEGGTNRSGLRRLDFPSPLPGHGLARRRVARISSKDKTPFAPRCARTDRGRGC